MFLSLILIKEDYLKVRFPIAAEVGLGTAAVTLQGLPIGGPKRMSVWPGTGKCGCIGKRNCPVKAPKNYNIY
jgi:hypothetical protein